MFSFFPLKTRGSHFHDLGSTKKTVDIFIFLFFFRLHWEDTHSCPTHTRTLTPSPYTLLPLADLGMVSGGSNLHAWCSRSVFITSSHMDKRASIYPHTRRTCAHTCSVAPLWAFVSHILEQTTSECKWTKQTVLDKYLLIKVCLNHKDEVLKVPTVIRLQRKFRHLL